MPSADNRDLTFVYSNQNLQMNLQTSTVLSLGKTDYKYISWHNNICFIQKLIKVFL